MNEMEAKGRQKGARSEPMGDQNASKSRPSEKVAKKSAHPYSSPDHFGSHFPSKMCSKIDAKFDVEKVWTFMRKCSQNDAKTRSRIDDKSMKFRNLRFLVFCEEGTHIGAKIWKKSIENEVRKSMRKKGRLPGPAWRVGGVWRPPS